MICPDAKGCGSKRVRVRSLSGEALAKTCSVAAFFVGVFTAIACAQTPPSPPQTTVHSHDVSIADYRQHLKALSTLVDNCQVRATSRAAILPWSVPTTACRSQSTPIMSSAWCVTAGCACCFRKPKIPIARRPSPHTKRRPGRPARAINHLAASESRESPFGRRSRPIQCARCAFTRPRPTTRRDAAGVSWP